MTENKKVKNIINTEIEVKSVISQINSLINLHQSMKNSYFWKSPGIASSRRNYEYNNSMSLSFVFKNYDVQLNCETSCSAKNIYYQGIFIINGEKKTISHVKKILKELEAFSSNENNKK